MSLIIISYSPWKHKFLTAFLYNRESISRVKLQDEWLTVAAISIPKCSRPQPQHAWLLPALLSSAKHGLALPSCSFLRNTLRLLGFETGPSLVVTQAGLSLQWAMPLTAEHTDRQPHTQENAFLQFQPFDSNATGANPEKENL